MRNESNRNGKEFLSKKKILYLIWNGTADRLYVGLG